MCLTMSAASDQQSVPVLEMSAVSVGARRDLRRLVLEEVNWSVAPGDYWVIGGMHNSGKSDFLATAAGLSPPQAGVCRVFGTPLPLQGEEGGRQRLRIGLVFDGGKPFHRLSVAENIALPLRYHPGIGGADPAERAREILELTELAPWAGQMPGTIGWAWEKRLGLARALVLKPELLLLDNPLGGLDSRHIHWWMGFLDKLSAGHPFLDNRPMTLVMAGGNLRPWRHRPLCLAVLQHQRFVSLGRRSDLLTVPEPLVRELLLEEAPAAT
jgi:ABC-type transporter Mla maintaining outer membrane lipid asymmetry ATPase subunit MlaF